jgi:hypothetical protein
MADKDILLANGVIYPGIDCDWFNHDIMRYLKKHTNLTWCGFYLPVRRDDGTSAVAAAKVFEGKRDFMKSLGWGLAPIYIGKQHDGQKLRDLAKLKLGEAAIKARLKLEGEKDGNEAVKGASDAGFKPPTVIYFDVEHPWTQKSEKDLFKEYLKVWFQTVQRSGYNGGIYCLHDIAADLHNAVGPAFIWAVNYLHSLTPHGDGGAWAAAQAIAAGKEPKAIGQKVDVHPNYPLVHPSESKYARATSWQMAGNCWIPAKFMNIAEKLSPHPRVKVDVNTSLFADPGMPFPVMV